MLFNVFYAAHQANLNIILISRTPDTSVKFSLKSDRVNLVAPASHIECLLYLPNDRAIQYKLGPEKLTRLGNSNVLRLPVTEVGKKIFFSNKRERIENMKFKL